MSSSNVSYCFSYIDRVNKPQKTVPETPIMLIKLFLKLIF